MTRSFRPWVLIFIALFFVSGQAFAGVASDLTIVEVDDSGLTVDCQTLDLTGPVNAIVKNVGAGGTGIGFDVLFFEDANGNGTYDDGVDLLLGTAAAPGALAPGEEAVVVANLNATVAFAWNLIYAYADSDEEIAEANEANNLGNSGESCQFEPEVGVFNPVLEWSWTSSIVAPDALNVMMTPAVVDINNDNVPDVVFGSTANTGGGSVIPGFLRALNGDDGSELFTVTNPSHLVNTASSVAVGDIDLDGMPEIIACHSGGINLIAFEHDGTFKWLSDAAEASILWGASNIADLNQDGTPEIVLGRQVFDNTGTLLWTGTGGIGFGFGPLSLVADVDLNGSPDVVAGNTLYSAAGAILWQNVAVADGINAVANFDDDDFAEIVNVKSGQVWLLEHDGSIKWGPVALPGGGRGGPPTVADYDGDLEPEIGVAGSSAYTVFETDGTVKWSVATQDFSSQTTGSSVFDFDGDGAAEVVYRDEVNLRVYRGLDGTVLFETPMGSCTWHEYVLVADVDADGNAEIVAVANNNCFGGAQRGVYVFGDADNAWVATREIWNQFNYNITNVNDDGTIPTIENYNWLFPVGDPYNNYRQNVLTDASPLVAPDLTASFLSLDTSPCPEGVSFTARIGNGGANVGPAPIDVAFYDGDPNGGGTLLGVATTSLDLDPGQYEDVTLSVMPALEGDFTICVVADDDGTGAGSLSECDEDNNMCCADFQISCTFDDLVLSLVRYRWGDPAPGYDFYGDTMLGIVEARIQNRGDYSVANVVAYMTDIPPNMRLEPECSSFGDPLWPDCDGEVSFPGTIDPGQFRWSSDSFTIQVDLLTVIDPCISPVWTVEYDDPNGFHHVLYPVSTFPVGEGPVACSGGFGFGDEVFAPFEPPVHKGPFTEPGPGDSRRLLQ